jgi:hypothetical protein
VREKREAPYSEIRIFIFFYLCSLWNIKGWKRFILGLVENCYRQRYRKGIVAKAAIEEKPDGVLDY